jgi:hypothetical protein
VRYDREENRNWAQGGFTVKKGTLFLLCNFFLLLGVVIGILLSPAKQGMTLHIGCNNGNSGSFCR